MNKKLPPIQLNMLMNVLLTLTSILIPLITMPYVARTLGAEGVGKVYFSQSVVTAFAAAAELGIPVYGIRACAMVRDDREKLSRTALEILIINLLTSAAAYIIMGITLLTVPKLAAGRRLILIMSSTIIFNAAGCEWLYKALEKYTYITIRTVLFKIAAMTAVFVLVRSPSDYIIYGWLTIFAALASDIVNLCLLHRYADVSRAAGLCRRPDLRRHLPAMFILFMLSAATMVYTNLDMTFLGFMKGDAEAGLYGVSVRIKLVLVSLITSVGAVLLPRTSSHYDKGEISEFGHLIGATLTAVNVVSIPVAFYFVLFADECIAVLAGSGFCGAVLPMRIIVPSIVIIGISGILGMQMLVPMGKETEVAGAAWLGAAVDIVLNLILIPGYASAGAAAATLVSELAVMLMLIRSVHRCGTGTMIDIRVIEISLCVSALSVPAGIWVKTITAGPLVCMIISAFCYFGVYAVIMLVLRRKKWIII